MNRERELRDPDIQERKKAFGHALFSVVELMIENNFKSEEDRTNPAVLLSTALQDEAILRGLCLGGPIESKETKE